MLQLLREKRESEGKYGTVPRDPELSNLKAVKIINNFHLLLCDRLMSNDVLDFAAPDAKLLYAGKVVGYHSRTQ